MRTLSYIRARGKKGLALNSISLKIEPGHLVGVVGPVGSSKSSLLMALLREIQPESSSGAAAGDDGDELAASGVFVEVRVIYLFPVVPVATAAGYLR